MHTPSMKKLILLLFLPFLCCKSPEGKNVQTSADLKEKLSQEIDSLLSSKIKPDGPGAAILVAYDGEELVAKGFGQRSIEDKAPITPATNMRMASVSKQFTALCILRLADQQLLSLDDQVTKYWPHPVFAGITIEHLLNHTSGIADYESVFMEEWDHSKIVENKDVLTWLNTNPAPVFPPGSSWEYSNTAYLVLALLVEKVSGMPFATFAREQVFKPAAMGRSTFYNLADPVEIDQRAFCYEKDSTGTWARRDGFFMNGVVGDGALYTSVHDYFNYDNALRSKAILSAEMHSKIFAPSSMAIPRDNGFYSFVSDFSFWEKEDVYYGMGWFLSGDVAFHSGSWNGTRTFVFRELERPLTIAVFLNSDAADLRADLFDETLQLVHQYLQHTEPAK